jgi:DNA-directed RNA polymerase specialized sigma24 family protein
MGRLTDRMRDLVTRRYRDGVPLDELASGMGWKTESVKVALSRARKALAECVHTKLREAGV